MLDTLNNITEILRSVVFFAFWGTCACIFGIIFASAFKCFINFVFETFS